MSLLLYEHKVDLIVPKEHIQCKKESISMLASIIFNIDDWETENASDTTSYIKFKYLKSDKLHEIFAKNLNVVAPFS